MWVIYFEFTPANLEYSWWSLFLIKQYYSFTIMIGKDHIKSTTKRYAKVAKGLIKLRDKEKISPPHLVRNQSMKLNMEKELSPVHSCPTPKKTWITFLNIRKSCRVFFFPIGLKWAQMSYLSCFHYFLLDKRSHYFSSRQKVHVIINCFSSLLYK